MANPVKMIGQLMRMQKEMKKIEVSGTSRDGLVKVKLNGLMKITGVEISDSLMSPESKRLVEAKLIEAHKEAQKKIESQMRSSMSLGDMQQMTGMMGR
jgi:DNA-binding YbaB/EbfC family protein